jgi:hypothetical protein
MLKIRHIIGTCLRVKVSCPGTRGEAKLTGKTSPLILLKPVEDITALRNVRIVIKDGHILYFDQHIGAVA